MGTWKPGTGDRLGYVPVLNIQGSTCSEGHCNNPNSGEGCEEVDLGVGERRAGSRSVPLLIPIPLLNIGRGLPKGVTRRGRRNAGRHVSISFVVCGDERQEHKGRHGVVATKRR